MNWRDDTKNCFNAIRKRKTRKTHSTTPIMKETAHRKVDHAITFIKPTLNIEIILKF